MYDPTTSQGSDTTGEWVEILNYSCESVDLAGWQIQDNFATDPLQPLDGINNMVLGPGQYAVIIDGTGSQVPDLFVIDPSARIFGTDDAQIGNQLADTGDHQVNLLDGAGGIVDAFAYAVTDASAGCGTAAKMNGYTLERKDPFGPSDCANFNSNAVRDSNLPIGGTPGSKNNLWVGASLPMSCVCA
jgi:hypothetical protein